MTRTSVISGMAVMVLVTLGVGGSPATAGPAATPVHAAGVSGTAVAAAPASGGTGQWVVWSNGGVQADGSARWLGDMSGTRLDAPMVGIAGDPVANGYWLLGGDGGVFSFGSAQFWGSTGGDHLVAPALQMVATSDGRGYWFVAGDGGIFSFGDARFHGSTGGLHLAKPAVGMAATPDGGGYWIVAADGGIFSFGDAVFHGSMGGQRLDRPVTAMAATSNGGGYWLLAQDGGIFALGNAGFHGSAAGAVPAGASAVGIVATSDGGGYWITLSDGTVLPYGDARTARCGEAPPAPAYDPDYAVAGDYWNPADPIHWIISTAVLASDGKTQVGTLTDGSARQADIEQALSSISRQTGFRFVDDGTEPTNANNGHQIVFQWEELAGGQGESSNYQTVKDPGYTPQITSGNVSIRSSLAPGYGTNGNSTYEGPQLLFGLGNVIGLDKINSTSQVMGGVRIASYQAGDLYGLCKVGDAATCVLPTKFKS